MVISEIRKLALFEFIDTSIVTETIKNILGQGDEEEDFGDFCDLEKDPNCGDDESDKDIFGRMLQEVVGIKKLPSAPKNDTDAQSTESEFDRLGSANILDNLGIMLFFSVVIILFIAIVFAVACILRTNKKV